MPPIFRADQSTLSIASEPGAGGYLDYISAINDAGDWTALIDIAAGLPAGSRSVTFDTASGTLAVGNYISLGAIATGNQELRRIASLGTYNGTNATGTVYLDYPTGFFHANNEALDEKVSTIDTTINQLTGLTGNSLITFLPGVWESVTVPELRPEITPYYFMGTSSDRNFTVAYRGRQAFTGGLDNFILLNGYALRFPLGTVATTGTDVGGGGGSTLSGAHNKGQRTILVTDGVNYDNGDYIQIDTGNSAEVRQIISGAGANGLAETFVLNYPLMIAHSTGVALNEVTSPYTHTIYESFDLDSMSWNIHVRDSSETRTNDFLRRYVGGKVNRATISAAEGETLRMSFDETIFLDMVHNQLYHSSIGGGTTFIEKSSAALIDPTAEAIAVASASRGVGGDVPHSAGALGIATYPTNEPYYFSQGTISLFGITFARIRNFRLDINNNLEPRYYIRDLATDRTPFEILEQRREYKMDATIATEDAIGSNATTRTLFKELILEGNYGSGMNGINITLTFTRGTNDSIVFTIPVGGAAGTGIDANGAFVINAPHNIVVGENPIQVPVEILFRNMRVVCTDSQGIFP